MDDRSEYKLLTLSLKRPRTYGAVQSYSSTQRQRFFVHHIESNDTLQGLALKYNTSMEKIKRANSLWTNDSIFLRKTLNIPIDSDSSPTLPDGSFNLNNQILNELHQQSDLPCKNRTDSNASSQQSAISNQSQRSSNGFADNFSDLSIELPSQNNEINEENQSNAMASTSKAQSVKTFLSRIDQLIAKSKDQMDTLNETGSEICKSVSEHDLFRVKSHLARRQTSINFDKSNRLSNGSTVSQDISSGVFSFRQLQERQQDELFEL